MRPTHVLCLASFLVFACAASELQSEGDSFAPVKAAGAAAIGKIMNLTLEQINIERNSDGAYLRLFGRGGGTMFAYLTNERLKNATAALDRGKFYIYRFRVVKNDSTFGPTGALIEIALTNGVLVTGSESDEKCGLKRIVLNGPAAHGASFRKDLVFNRFNEKTLTASFSDRSPYSTELVLAVTSNRQAEMAGLERGTVLTLDFRVTATDWRVFGTLENLARTAR